MERYYSYSHFLKEFFGEKIYKICIDGGFTCPNRDGMVAEGGCIFCSEGGSGEFSENAVLSIDEQICSGKKQTAKKYSGNKYIAYFQAFTNTYGPVDHLKSLYEMAIKPEEIVALSIGTRPDCLDSDVLQLLSSINKRKPVFLELGLQTCHDKTASFLNRGYKTEIFTHAVYACKRYGLRITAHIILGLPGEDLGMELETIKYLNTLPIDGIKISMLYVVKGTALADIYSKEPFPVFTLASYVDHVIACLEILRPDIVIERITGDCPKELLIAPVFSLHKRNVLNMIHKEMKRRDTHQGKYTK